MQLSELYFQSKGVFKLNGNGLKKYSMHPFSKLMIWRIVPICGSKEKLE